METPIRAMKVCALIPAYNEAAGIAAVIDGCARHVDEVLVVDDGSSDATAQAAEDAGATVIIHKHNKGKGAAIRTGFGHVRGHEFDAVIILDGDGQHDSRDIPRFIETAETTGAAVVLGNRMGDVAEMPALRRWTNRTTSGILSRLAGQRLPDSQCGFRLIRAAVLADLELRTANYETESEMLLQAAWAGHTIVSIPIATIYNEAPSHIHKVRDTWRFIKLAARALVQRSRFKRARSKRRHARRARETQEPEP